MQSITSNLVPSLPKESLSDAWHTYAVLWTAAGYTFYLDGVALWSSKSGVSMRSEFLLLTCEVETSGWAGNIPSTGYGPADSSSTQMHVDWVRAWKPAH
jgi:hypothetical protein